MPHRQNMRLLHRWILAVLLLCFSLTHRDSILRAFFSIPKEHIEIKSFADERKMVEARKQKRQELQIKDAESAQTLLSKPYYRLPDLVISGQKKCGTKALQFFFLHHPDVIGTRQEAQLRGFGNFTFELASYLGKLNWPGDKVKTLKESRETRGNQQVHVTKTQLGVGASRIKDFRRKVKEELEKPRADQIPWLDRVEPPLEKWLESMRVVSIVCDPVKRLLSDFTHVSDDHDKDGTWLGKDSQMYPFANLTFDQMVDQYLPRATQILKTNDLNEWKKIPLFFMFIRGHYDDIFALNELFAERFILIDGEQFKKEPWVALQTLERAFGLEPFFTQDRFGQREDGFYCVKTPSKVSKLSCMPSYKGVTGLGKKTMTENTRQKLTEFYKPSYERFQSFYHNKLSWM